MHDIISQLYGPVLELTSAERVAFTTATQDRLGQFWQAVPPEERGQNVLPAPPWIFQLQ